MDFKLFLKLTALFITIICLGLVGLAYGQDSQDGYVYSQQVHYNVMAQRNIRAMQDLDRKSASGYYDQDEQLAAQREITRNAARLQQQQENLQYLQQTADTY